MFYKRNLSIIAVVFAFFAVLACSSNTVMGEKITRFSNPEAQPTPPATTRGRTVEKNDSIKIAAVGDIMLASTFPDESRMPPNDGVDMLKDVTPLLSSADVAFGNLEGPLTDGGISVKCGKGRSRCFAFRMPTRYGKYLKEAGFDVVSVANNHALDFGTKGQDDTRFTLDSLGIKHAGADRGRFASTIVETKGKKIGFIGFATNSVSPNVNDLAIARQLVTDLAKRSDIVVVSFHGGAEGPEAMNVPNKTEYFYREARGNLPLFSRTVIDAGADLVLGHGPHVLRGMEIYKDRLIAYSLGNFATYGWFRLEGATAESLVLEVEIDGEGKFLKGKINPVRLEGRGIPVLDKTNSAISTIRNLSITDFQENAPKIADDGTLSPK